MHKIMKLKEKVCDKLEEYADRPTLNANDVEMVDTLAHATKNLMEIVEESDEEYSGRGRSYGYVTPMTDGRSYARRRGYSRGKDMVAELHELMADADSEPVRREFK